MAVNPNSAFIWGGSGVPMTPEEVEQARLLERRAQSKGIDTSPVSHWSQGAARVADAIAGAFRRGALEKAAGENATYDQGLLSSIIGGGAAYPSSVAAGGSPTAPAATGVSSEAPVIKAKLLERGIPEHVADGFVANFADESGLNSGINERNPTVEGSRGGYGLYQLTGPRRVAYEKFAADRGVSPSDVDTQLDFLVSELKGPEAGAAAKIFAAPDSGTAAAAIATNFLRPNAKSLAERVAKYTSGGMPIIPVSAGLGDQGATTQLSPEVRAQRLASNQAGMANVSDVTAPSGVPIPVQTASLDPSVGMGGKDVITVPPIEAVQGVGTGNIPAGTGGGQPVLDFTSQPNLSVAANIPFDNSGTPGNMGNVIPPQAVASPAATGSRRVYDALAALPLRAVADPNDRLVAGPEGTLQPSAAETSGLFPPAPSMDIPAVQTANAVPDNTILLKAMTDPRASASTKAVAEALYKRNLATAGAAQEEEAKRRQFLFEQNYKEGLPSTRTDIASKEASIAESKARVADMAKTGNIKDYEDYAAFEEKSGRTPLGPLEYRKALSAASAPKTEGAIPQGYQAVRDPQGNIERYEPIPGGPADTSKKDIAAQIGQAITSDVIVNAADLARKALNAKGLPATGSLGKMTAGIPESNAAEVRRQVAVLKSNATIEALNAMRQQSPTGGALGNVTEGEGQMLAAKAGALDPDSPNFARDLNDYEETLLRTVHGPDAGENIYWEKRPLPQGVTEEDIAATMKANSMSRRQVMEKLYGGS